MCCTSLRGAAYFCSSIHLTIGAVLFIRYVIVTAFLTFFNVTDVIKDRITGYLLPFVAYITLFLAFGIVIFHSVEKEYFIILRWATLGFSLLQLVVLVALYTLKFVPTSTYEYRQFPFLPVSITEAYVNSGFQTSAAEGPGSSTHGDSLSGENYAENLPKLTRNPSTGIYPTSATESSSGSRRHGSGGRTSSSSEIFKGIEGGGSDLDFIHPVPTPPPNRWLGEVYSLIALIVMTVVTIAYMVLLFIYVRQLIYEDSGQVFGRAQSVRHLAFYVQPQFAESSGNSDNKIANSPSPALRGSQQANCTELPKEFQPQATQRQGNHLKPGSTIDPSITHSKTVNQQQHSNTQLQQSAHPQSQSNQSQNHVPQRSPVPPCSSMQQMQQQQQVITIYPQKGGGFTSSSSSPRMQVKFAKPLESLPHSHSSGDPGAHHPPPEPTRSCLANAGNSQAPQQTTAPSQAQMMPPPPPPRSQSQRLDSQGRPPPPNQFPPPPCIGGQYQPVCGQPPPLPPHQQHGNVPQHPSTPVGFPYHQPPPQHSQHMPYHHGKSRAQQQTYNDMVDNSSYLVFSGNPNSSMPPSGAPPPALHPSHLTSASHTYPHCSQRRPSGSMV